ncbi:MAG: sigma-70 family RNA polymerase sigma factor [Phycisphaerae bacterium]|nr:sigma-70 family RNA polymerase sigma factor [Phycisphaerae bacterium]MDD5382004.1 sigma-70 family RNA polymerase sigma factor [Phycisphaerae bacterium]
MTETANINTDDAILVQQCQMGDSEAAERLIRKYQSRIYNAIFRICANPDDAAELTQDTFVKIIENIDNFQGRSSFYTWAFRIGVNLTLNYCQRNAKLGLKSLDAEDSSDDDAKGVLKNFLTDSSLPDPAAVAQNKELCGLVTKALGKLDDAHRAVIVLRDIEGMNYAQIAEVLDIELGTVRSRLSRARTSLREVMEALI